MRFNSSGQLWQMEQSRFPRALYWDTMARMTHAATIHFEDVPELARFDCPDDEHMDCRDAPAFTAALVSELGRRGLLP